ncbi:uncharacterized protein LOC128210949 [Mya arenaria]|uniref:uncharacterized protein LOC128210949 n=1 Tax=Mya arenaria TaxID=6604 RepID=UPI0022E3922F|nr:uncharacterized protein LOC128210949 [Mya arenaria]XP_052771250.1 uncharacterized protein LOC128210949 [Mya arenaria]
MDSDWILSTVTSRLQSVIRCLNTEPDIQRQLMEIESKCGAFILDFQAVLRNEGETLFSEKETLMATTSIKTLSTEKPLKSLHKIGIATEKLKSQIRAVRTKVGSTLEECHSRIKAKEKELLLNRNEIDKNKSVISKFEEEKMKLEKDADLDARQKEQKAARPRNEAEDRKQAGACDPIIGELTAAALMPFTAVGSLLALVAGSVTMAVLLTSAAELERDAGNKKELARQKKNESQTISQTIRVREIECKTKEQEVRAIESDISRLINEQNSLSDVSNLLFKVVDSIMRLQFVFKNMEATFRDTYQKTKVLKAFEKKYTLGPEMLEMANSLLDKTKKRWNEMENELVQQELVVKAGSSLTFVTKNKGRTCLNF